MERGSEDPFAALFTGSIKAKIAGSIKAIIDIIGLPQYSRPLSVRICSTVIPSDA